MSGWLRSNVSAPSWYTEPLISRLPLTAAKCNGVFPQFAVGFLSSTFSKMSFLGGRANL